MKDRVWKCPTSVAEISVVLQRRGVRHGQQHRVPSGDSEDAQSVSGRIH